MGDPIDQRKLAAEFNSDGAFSVINRYVKSGQISPDEASAWVAQTFQLYAAKVREAQKEVRHLDAVLARLAHVTAEGGRKHRYQPVDPLVLSLARECTTFDNWVMSIYETDLTMIHYANPARAKAKPQEMAKSLDALYQKRLQDMNFALNAPDLFTQG